MKLKDALLKLQKDIQTRGLDVLLIEDPLDLFYLTGLTLSTGSLYVSAKEAHLFVDGRYIEQATKCAGFPVSLSQEENIRRFLKSLSPKKIGCDGKKISYDHFLELQAKGRFPLESQSAVFKKLRAVKNKEEIKKLQKSADHLYEGFLYIKKKLKSGIEEQELAHLFEIYCLKQGADCLGFSPIIAFGPHSAMPHYRAGKAKLAKDQIVLMDLGVVVDGYHSDMTRTFFFGKKDPFLKKAREIVREAKKAALELLRPGMRAGALDEAAIRVFEAYGVREHYLHTLGHGVGLEIHEFPRLSHKGEDKDVILEEGMVVTVEPGLYFSGKGGIRDEDTFVITKTGYHNFYGKHGIVD